MPEVRKVAVSMVMCDKKTRKCVLVPIHVHHNGRGFMAMLTLDGKQTVLHCEWNNTENLI